MDREMRETERVALSGDAEAAERLKQMKARTEEQTPVAFFIHCATGCSCCNSENHYTGPYRSLKHTKETMEGYQKTGRLGSQYAPKGNYTICWSKAEILPDGRVICDDRVFSGFADDGEWGADIDDGFYPDSHNLSKLPKGYYSGD